MLNRLGAMGFEPERARYALRTSLAACVALMAAWMIGLEHPQWSAMTVFAASQPFRNMLMEKSFFRAVGTLVGSCVGVLLILASEGHPAFLVVGLAVWVGVCAGIGNVLRGFLSYGTLLAGYTASMVALLETAHPGNVLALGADRFLTAIVGVLVAMIAGLLFTPRSSEDVLVVRMCQLTMDMLSGLATVAQGRPGPTEGDCRAMLSEMSAIEDGLDPHGAGSLRSRKSVRTLRSVMMAHLSLLVWLRSSPSLAGTEALAAALGKAVIQHRQHGFGEGFLAALSEAADHAAAYPDLHDILERLHSALKERLEVREGGPIRRGARAHLVVLHRDWVGARQATLRASGVMLLLGAIWLATGWSAGPYVLLGTSVMISLFSTFENPALIMRYILAGQIFGAAGAFVCRWLVWPHAGGELDLILMLLPFVLSSVVPLSHRRTFPSGTDYVLVMLLLSEPVFPLTGSIGGWLHQAAAVVVAPAIALVAFRLIFPADSRRRLRSLIAVMVGEVEAMATAGNALSHRHVWRARLYHRLLRLERMDTLRTPGDPSASEGGLALLQVGTAVLTLRGLALAPAAEGLREDVSGALKNVGRLSQSPSVVAAALSSVAQQVRGAGLAGADSLERAAASIESHAGFFTTGSKPQGPLRAPQAPIR